MEHLTPALTPALTPTLTLTLVIGTVSEASLEPLPRLCLGARIAAFSLQRPAVRPAAPACSVQPAASSLQPAACNLAAPIERRNPEPEPEP